MRPSLGGAIPGMVTMDWTCVWNEVKTVRKAGAHFATSGDSTNRWRYSRIMARMKDSTLR